MGHAIHRVTAFQLCSDYVIEVAFEDGVRRTIDFGPVLRGRLFGPLRDPALFAAVRLDEEVGTLVWPNDADFDPTTLHDWPSVVDAFAELASSWGAAEEDRQPAG